MMNNTERMFQILREKIETLTGERGAGTKRAALYSEITGIKNAKKIDVPNLTSSAAAGAAPTKAEYDKLVEDVKTLRKVFIDIITTF